MTYSLDPGVLLRTARENAGLSQRALAKRAGTAQSVVARIELGETSPSVRTLNRLLQAAGFEVRGELRVRPVVGSHMFNDAARILALTPEQRLMEAANLSRLERATRRV